MCFLQECYIHIINFQALQKEKKLQEPLLLLVCL